jgi:hypothetical protein
MTGFWNKRLISTETGWLQVLLLESGSCDMRRALLAISLIVLCLLFWPRLSRAQLAEAPAYKDGDWWRVKSEVEFRKARSTSSCDVNYPEYLVTIVQGKPKVFGLKEGAKDEINCPIVSFRLLGRGDKSSANASEDTDEADEWEVEYLKFPLSLGQTWTSRVPEVKGKTHGKAGHVMRWADLEYKVVGWEKIRTGTMQLDTFKIDASGGRRGLVSYYYGPDAKAIVRLRFNTERSKRTVSVVDFKVSP